MPKETTNNNEGNSAEESEAIFHAEEAHHASSNSKRWLLDSGATCHMVANKRWFTNLRQIAPISIIFGGQGLTAQALARGTVTVHNYVEGKLKKLVFNDVLYVTEARHHLISTSALVDKGASILFRNKVARASMGKQVVLEARNSGKLWELAIAPEIMQVYSAEAATDACELWHQRFGHINSRSLQETMKLYKVPFPKDVTIHDCIGCMLGKSVKSPFRMTEERATKPFEMIHSDISGPFREPTPTGANYFAIVVDDYTKHIKVQPISNKDHARVFLQNYIKTIHQQTLYKVQTVRTDNDSVYCSREAEAWFKAEGIHHQLTVPYSPQSNGVAERNIRTLKEMGSALLHNASIKYNLNDPSLWGEAVKHAAHILNNTYKKELKGTPNQTIWNRLPNIGSYRVWGCPAWTHLDPAQRKGGTWAAKRELGYHVGFADGVKGYRIYYPDKAGQWKFSAARDVTFIEKPQQGATYAHNALLSENLGEASSELKLPQNYSQAMKSPESLKWLQAMQEEMNSIESKGTFVLSDLPAGRKAVGCRWVYATKPSVGDTPARYKARLVAQGFSQMPGLDYSETFAPVARYGSLRVFLAIAASRNYELVQADVVTAFLNGSLEEEIYMKQPPGFEDPNAPHKVCRLIKSLYGLKQAGRVWTDKLRAALTSMGFAPISGDDCIYSNKAKSAFIITYVDDLLVASASKHYAEKVLKELGTRFKLKHLGEPNFP